MNVLRANLKCPNTFTVQSRSAWTPPGGKSILDRRLPRKLKVGETRPPIYYKFDCTVELSDGSTITRRSQFPKTEWRYLADVRNNLRWNPSRYNLRVQESDAGGRMAKFKKKFGQMGSVASGSSEPEPATTTPAAEPAKEDTKAPEEASTTTASSSSSSSTTTTAAGDFDFDDLMGENFVPVQSGGKLAQRKKKSKKGKK